MISTHGHCLLSTCSLEKLQAVTVQFDGAPRMALNEGAKVVFKFVLG